jgi:hypothetical protein
MKKKEIPVSSILESIFINTQFFVEIAIKIMYLNRNGICSGGVNNLLNMGLL